MRWRRMACLTLAAAWLPMAAAVGANLLQNGDFETIAADENGPLLDGYGLEQPTNWFRAVSAPADFVTPVTSLISPGNRNNAAGDEAGDDSDGAGTNAAALNFTTDGSPVGLPSDWRSAAVDTVPGETLVFSMDFKFIGVSPDDDVFPDFFNGLYAQVRSFGELAEDGGTANPFVGERNLPIQWRANYDPDVWHTVRDRVEIPEGGEYTDIRISVNTFNPAWLFNGQVLIDNVQLIRLTADFNDDLVVDGADLALWEAGFGVDAQGDANADGVTDGLDLLVWQREVGVAIPEFLPPVDPPTAAAAATAIPEPGSAVLAAGWLLLAGAACRKR